LNVLPQISQRSFLPNVINSQPQDPRIPHQASQLCNHPS
jgi:hypothetical protein